MRKSWIRTGAALLLAAALAGGLAAHAGAAQADTLAAAVRDTAAYVCEAAEKPQVGSIGGEWAVLGLARSGYGVPEGYYQDYYAAVEEYVKACGGVLHEKKYTEYSRLIVALTAIGKDARSVAGYDLTKALGDYDKTVWQGLNGPIWALLALDSAGYPMPENPEAETQATRQMYVEHILDCRLPDGGWSLFGGTPAGSPGDAVSDPDITGMALQALAKYQDQPAVARATQEALACMSEQQDGGGGFSSWGTGNLESCVQMAVALCELGIPLDDPRFVKNGCTVLDGLMAYYREGAGFVHAGNGSGSNQMATEQGLYGLAAIQRALEGKNSLYRMGNAAALTDAADGPARGEGLEGRDPAVTPVPVTAPGRTFPDLAACEQAPAVEALAARGIITGRPDGTFDPDGSMTRAEFTAIAVRALGLAPEAGRAFTDVPAGAWYEGYVGTACKAGIVTGTGDGSAFTPDGTITRQEAAVMAARAAALCGLDTAMAGAETRNMLAQFPDYRSAAPWAWTALAVCCREGILDQGELYLRPLDAATRAEVAQMLFALLDAANLLQG